MLLLKKLALSAIRSKIKCLSDIVSIDEVVEMIEEEFDVKDRCNECAHEYKYLQGV